MIQVLTGLWMGVALVAAWAAAFGLSIKGGMWVGERFNSRAAGWIVGVALFLVGAVGAGSVSDAFHDYDCHHYHHCSEGDGDDDADWI